MKVFPFKIPKPEHSTLIVQNDKVDMLYNKLHQHREIQISYVVRGEGNCIIGDFVGEFKKNDVFIIGENVPHVFNNDPSDEGVHVISLFFTQSSFGQHFFEFPEFKRFNTIFHRASLGIKIKPATDQLGVLFFKIPSKSKFEKFIDFMNILQLISKEKLVTLSSEIHNKSYGEEEGKRMRDIFEFTLSKYDENISLEQVAEIANMTPNAFCRYFKQRTNKTYINFLLDIRIENACKLLAKKSDLSIAEISYRCGFNNLTNFNRKFKSIKNMTPSEFRKKVK
ncbi:AraC family transcriptional regulator [Lutimonas saemankumensis]|uniref:AraC family transcriptional regulator n=1 Tax=Lutimonas saemankumensis TaxID=483016 RepID=UPI001CD72210|nr:AraC family transcriptional regulator [Lutimonas saemankumensis]MCA0933383.1 AraC family transcriptional regulator [Lutimonas saemankumensis]